jgi:hypothetical protein
VPGKTGDDFLGGAVRQAAEDDIERRPVDLADCDQIGEVFAGKVRKDRADRLPGLTVGGQGRDLGLRVIAQEAQQLGPCVSARAEYSDPKPILGGHVWSLSCGVIRQTAGFP